MRLTIRCEYYFFKNDIIKKIRLSLCATVCFVHVNHIQSIIYFPLYVHNADNKALLVDKFLAFHLLSEQAYYNTIQSTIHVLVAIASTMVGSNATYIKAACVSCRFNLLLKFITNR